MWGRQSCRQARLLAGLSGPSGDARKSRNVFMTCIDPVATQGAVGRVGAPGNSRNSELAARHERAPAVFSLHRNEGFLSGGRASAGRFTGNRGWTSIAI